MDVVDETLREWRRSAFVYGQSDCMLSIGQYLARTGHRDVTGQFLSQYSTAEGAEAQMAAHGGIPGLLALAGAVVKTGAPSRGDVLEIAYDDGSIGGLCTGDSAAVRLERGVVELKLRFLTILGVWAGSA
ncbi:hypothetical protein LH19_07190 [Sphingopyxis macrogoltabida]|nr:hypothetical protein LH19_07190 [Sphingopyxis macrogoltabida]